MELPIGLPRELGDPPEVATPATLYGDVVLFRETFSKKARPNKTMSELSLSPRNGAVVTRAARRVFALGLSLCVVAGACRSSSTSPARSSSDAGTDTGAPRSSAPLTIDELATAGLPVFADANAAAPVVPVTTAVGPTPLRLLGSQADAMSQEAAAGQGVLGADLDALVVLPAGMPTASYFLAGYVSGAGTPGAALAHKIMGDQDFRNAPTLVYPSVILALFAADAGRYADALGVAPSGGATTGALSVPLPPGLCSKTQDFITSTISSFFDTLGHLQSPQVPKSGVGIVDWFGSGLQTAFDLATGVVNGLIDGGRFVVIQGIKSATQPVLDVITTLAGTAALAAMVVDLLRPWTVIVTATPPRTSRVTAPGAGLPGAFRATVTMPGDVDEWPALFVDCAQVAMITLPPLKPVGAPLTWTVMQSPATLVVPTGTAATALDENAAATFDYVTVSETARDARGEALEGKVKSDIAITRKEISDLQKTVSDLLFSRIPPLLSPYLTPFLKPAVEAVLQLPVSLLATHGYAPLVVTYHECTVGDCCPTGLIACGDSCVDIGSDSVNCGACGNACAGGESCAGGVCVPAPKPTACTPACPADQTCRGGSCVPSGVVASCLAKAVDPGKFCTDFTGSGFTLANTQVSCEAGGHTWSPAPCPVANRLGSCLAGDGPGAFITRFYPGDTNPVCDTCQTAADCPETHPCMGGCCDNHWTLQDAARSCGCAAPDDANCPNWLPH